MSDPIQNGVRVDSWENLGSPRTIVARKKKGEIEEEYQGQRRAKIYADLSSDLKLCTSCYTSDGIELVVESKLLVEYKDINKLTLKLPANVISESYLHKKFQEEHSAILNDFTSDKKLEEILDKELKYTVRMDMDSHLNEYGIRVKECITSYKIGERKYTKDELKEILEKIPKREEVNTAVEELKRKHEEQYSQVRDEFQSKMVALETKVEEGRSREEILREVQKNLGELKTGVERVSDEYTHDSAEKTKNYELLSEKIVGLEGVVGTLVAEKNLSKEQIKTLLKEVSGYIIEDFKEVAEEVSDSCAREVTVSMIAIDPRLAYNEFAKEIIRLGLKAKLQEDQRKRGVISGIIPSG